MIKSAPPTVELWSPDRSYRYPNIDKELQALKFSSIMYGGFATCTFELYRKPWVHYPDLALGNKVAIRSRHQIVWYGSIAAPATDTTDLKLSIQADGPIENLKTRLALVNLLAATKGSTWIIANLIGDLGYGAGNIYTSDYEYETGIDFTAGVAYSEAVTDINKGDNYRYGFFPPAQSNYTSAEGFDFWPISSTPEYYLDMADCDTKIQYTQEGIENVLYVKYNDGADHYFWWPHGGGGVAIPDAASVALYDRRDGKLDISGTVTLAEAEHLAQVALDWRKRIRPAADITARKITDVNGAEVPLAEVQAGRVLHIRGLNPGEFTLLTAQSLNELCTWPIIMSAPDIDACTVTLSPGGLGNTLDKLLARVEMVKRT